MERERANSMPNSDFELEKRTAVEALVRGGKLQRSPKLKRGRTTEAETQEQECELKKMERIEQMLTEILENQKRQERNLEHKLEEWGNKIQQQVAEQVKMDQEKDRRKWEEDLEECKRVWSMWKESWERQQQELVDKIDDLENRGRRQNVIIRGLN